MSMVRFLSTVAVVVAAAAAHAGPGQDAKLGAAADPHRGSPLAAAAHRQLRRDGAASASTEPADMKTRADAEMAARDARTKGPRLQVKGQNLKGDAAARAIARRTTPNKIDHDTAYGDKDHTEQVTRLKVTIKK